MTKHESAIRSPRSAIIGVCIVTFYLLGLSIPLVGPDEPRYAQVAREMFERGDWVTPTLGGFNWFEKPALLYWLQIASYNLFGVNEFAARFGSALFGLGTIASLWILGRNSATEVSNTGKLENSLPSVVNNFGNLLALIAASTIGIIVFSRGASFDIILTFPMTAALVSFYIFDCRIKSQVTASSFDIYIPLFSFYFFIGLALLAKGLVGIIFPFAIVAFYHVLSWRIPSKSFFFSLFWGTIVSILVASSWYLPMYLTHGWGFIDEFFIQHHFQRYTSNKYFHPQPFYFFFWVLPLMTIPWLPFFLAAIWDFGKKLFQRRDTENTEEKSPRLRAPASPLLVFSFAWLLVPLVFFSFSGSKLPGYILPSVPPAILITSIYVWNFVEKNRIRERLVHLFAYGTFAVIVGLLIFVVPRFAETDSVKPLIKTANERGYKDAKVLSLHGVFHNAEFYAAGRLLRATDGKQRKLLGPSEVLEQIRKGGGKPVLVLVPQEWLSQLHQAEYLKSELLMESGEVAIVAATER
ncbi:MAG: ArnT family glycosyltransferase [Blastocatellia bacterium]